MSKTLRVHIIKREKGWAIMKEGMTRATSVFVKKESAVIAAKNHIKQGYDIVIHNSDGSISSWEKSK